MQMAYAEIGNFIFKGNRFAKTKLGQKVIHDSGVLGQMPKYFAGEFVTSSKLNWFHPLFMFNSAEIANHKDTVAGGYLFARNVFKLSPEKIKAKGYEYITEYLTAAKGDKHKAALEYAKDLDNDCNFIYNNSDLPKIFRQPFLRASLQFKAYPFLFVQQGMKWFTEMLQNPTPHNIARMVRFGYMNVLLGGIRAIPLVGRMAWWFVLPMLALLHPKLKDTVGRGIFSLLGIDLSVRFGPNDFIPSNIGEWFGGPTGKDIWNLYRVARKEIGLPEAVASMSSAVRDIYRAFHSDSDEFRNPNDRWRLIEKINPWEKIMSSVGAPLLKIEMIKDLKIIANEMERSYRKKKGNAVDEILNRISRNLPYQDVLKKAKEDGIFLTSGDLNREKKSKETPTMQLRYKTMSRGLRKEFQDLYHYAFPEKR
jgi:hypothetical protein